MNVDRMQMYDQIFDGRIYRAHNTAISSIIAKAIEEKRRYWENAECPGQTHFKSRTKAKSSQLQDSFNCENN